MPVVEHRLDAVPVTSGPRFHYFGYYDKTPWDATGRYLLALEVDFMDRPPDVADLATIGMVDLHDANRFLPITQTAAINWQQGTHLQWMPTAPDREIIFNTVTPDDYSAVVRDVFTGRERHLPLPIYDVSRNGKLAVTLNFDRLHTTRPGYGYHHFPDRAGPDVPSAHDDGIWLLDLETGAHDLVVSLRGAIDFAPTDDMFDARHWFNHLLFSPDDSCFIFLHRWVSRTNHPWGWKTRLFTANPNGSDLCLLNADDMTSHFDWCGPDQVLAWAHRHDRGDHYYLFRDRTAEIETVGEDVLLTDGHCSYSPDGRWILTDTYPDEEHKRALVLYRPEDNLRIDVGRFYSPPEFQDPDPLKSRYEMRCDLHPRWSRDGRQVCFDSMHEGERQMYVMDVSPVVTD
jgi:hypothetical protein